MQVCKTKEGSLYKKIPIHELTGSCRPLTNVPLDNIATCLHYSQTVYKAILLNLFLH